MTADNRQLNVILWEIHCTKSNYQRVLTILLPIPYTLKLSRYAVFWARMCNPTSKTCVLVTVAIQSMIYNYCFALNEYNSNKDADRSCNLGYSLLLKLQHLSFPFLFCWYAYCRFFNCIFFFWLAQHDISVSILQWFCHTKLLLKWKHRPWWLP